MNWFSVPQLADSLDLNPATVRKYISNFSEYFFERKFGGVKKYPKDETTEILKCISVLYQNRKTPPEIRQALQNEYKTGKIVGAMNHNEDLNGFETLSDLPFEKAGNRISAEFSHLTGSVDHLKTILSEIKTLISEASIERNHIINELKEIRKQVDELEKKVEGTVLKPSSNGVLVEINPLKTDKNPILNFITPSQSDDEADVIDDTFNVKDMIGAMIGKKSDAGYRNAVMEQIKSLRVQNGMTYSGIADYLNNEGLPTFSGRGKWTTGQVGRLVSDARKSGKENR